MAVPTTINLSDTTPAAPSGRQNVAWQCDSNNPRNVSANFPALTNFAVLNAANTFTAANTIKYPGQAYLDLWNSTTGGTPTGGSHWRIFADNQGGGGGLLTWGVYDVANGRLPFGITNSGAIGGTFGGWIPWTPTVVPVGGMTATAASSYSQTNYIAVGPIIFFNCRFTTTLGAPMGIEIQITGVPVSSISGNTMMVVANVNGLNNTITAWVAGTTITVINSVVYTAGSNTFTISGFYQWA